MNPVRPLTAVALLALLLAPLGASAQTPTLINYQGRLVDGTNLVNGTVNMALTLYNSPSGGGFQYVDTGSVVVVDGLYSTFLGDGTSLGTLTNALIQTNVYLEVTVNGVTLTPRERVASVAYAVRSLRAETFGGAILDSQLSTNIARLNGTNQVFSQTVNFNNVSNTFYGTFVGNGGSVTNLQLTALTDPGVFTWGGHFAVASSPSVNFQPRHVAAADLNGDGRMDLAYVSVSNSLSVLTGNGDGNFTFSSTLAVGLNPKFVIAADVTADGKIDLITANNTAGTLSVLTNNGSGGFTLSTSPFAGIAPICVAAADVNADGRMDLISANDSVDTLGVLTNNGAGIFTLSSSPGVGITPIFVIATDVTGDGKADLISADQDSNRLSLLTNNGSGSFGAAIPLSLGLASPGSGVLAADVNADGHMDLVSVNDLSDSLTVLTNNGAGGFTISSTVGVAQLPLYGVAADVNGDGKVDLVSASGFTNVLSVLTNNGSGSFTLCSEPAVGDFPKSIAAFDANGDGKVDLVTANNHDDTLSVLLNVPVIYGQFRGDGSGLVSAAGWVRDGANISYNITNGNVGIGTVSPTNKLQVVGTVQATAYITGSDRNSKENFAPVSPVDVLDKVAALPISTWNFKTDSSGTHMGPMAQDFRAAFGLGNTDSGIFTVDADGVALAAIQALYRENQDLKKRVEDLERRLDETQPAP